MKLEELNNFRKGETFKKPEDESFIEELNETLYQKEKKWYRDIPISNPLIFVYGLPRSGTTLTAQVLAHGLNFNFIDNLSARFYLAPLHGIKFSKAISAGRSSKFQSDHAQTHDLTDIHEFGYFWRHHLHKNGLLAATQLQKDEAQIDWKTLTTVLANMLEEWKGPAVFKNIFGAYHMAAFAREIPNCLFVYIERNPVDVGVSIYEARKKFYGNDVKKWWSTAPPEVESLLNESVGRQIAGQVFYLRQFYHRMMKITPPRNHLNLSYEELTENPHRCIAKVSEHLNKNGQECISTPERVPQTFESRTYSPKHPFISQFEKEFRYFESEIEN